MIVNDDYMRWQYDERRVTYLIEYLRQFIVTERCLISPKTLGLYRIVNI